MPLNNRPDPYVAFKDDLMRLLALVSRDVRLVVIALIGTGVITWLTRLFH